METSPKQPPGDELRPEYDLKSLPNPVRGKYAARYHERLRLVHLDADVASNFQNDDEVNAALRTYLEEHGRVRCADH